MTVFSVVLWTTVMHSVQIFSQRVTIVGASQFKPSLHVFVTKRVRDKFFDVSFGLHFMWGLLNLTSIPPTLKNRL